MLDFLAEHAPPGIFRFEIGVQSTNDPTNEAVQRRQNFAKLSRTVTKIKDSGKIAQHLDLIAGLPHEDYDTFRKTFNDVFALRPEELQLGFLKMLRGTGLRRDAEKYGYVYMDRAPYEILATMCCPSAISCGSNASRMCWRNIGTRTGWTARCCIWRSGCSSRRLISSSSSGITGKSGAGSGSAISWKICSPGCGRSSRIAAPSGSWSGIWRSVCMKIDYFLNHKYKPRAVWWEFRMDKREHAAWMRRLAERPEDVSPAFAALGRTRSSCRSTR